MSPRSLDPLRIPDGFWHRDDVRQALDVRSIGRLLHLVQRYAGASQTQIGIAIGFDQGTVSRTMKGTRVIEAIEVLERIADGLAMPDEARVRLGLAPQNGSTSEAEPPTAERTVTHELRELLHGFVVGGQRQPSAAVMAGVEQVRRSVDRTLVATGTITLSQVDDLEATAQANAKQCVFMPPLTMLCRLTLDLAELQDLVTGRQRPPVQQGLYRVVAQLATLIADELMVLGDVRQSRAWHGTARFAADQTSDTALRADVRTLAALLPLYYGDAAEAVSFARQAQAVAGATPGLTSALAPTYEALALAQLAASANSEAALATARDQVERLDSTHQAESVFGFSLRRWRFYEGKILSYLGRTDEAWATHDEALELYPEEVVGDPALIRLDRAISLVRGRQVAAGCELAGQTLLDLPVEHRTDLFVRAAHRVLSLVPSDQRDTTPVRQYRETIRSCAVVR